MVTVIVGGRPFDFDRDRIVRQFANVRPEPVREHVVELPSGLYPPKQVVSTVTGWPRTSFTTMEAQRALTRAGLTCRRAGPKTADTDQPTREDGSQRIVELESRLRVTEQAIANLADRLDRLERSASTR
jgi:hypothetical protein